MNATTTHRHVTWTPYLRPSPVAAEAALRVLSVGELDPATLALVIGSDPGLTAAVIRASEPAAMDTSVASRITGLSPARLHSALFPALVDSLAANASPFTDADADAATWRTSLATAIAAEALARESGAANQEAAYLAGLFHNCEGPPIDDPSAPGSPQSFRAIGRRYRFPAWLLDTLDRHCSGWANLETTGLLGLNRVLLLARSMATSLVAEGASTGAALSNAARQLQFDPDCVYPVCEIARRSLERRLSLFAFTPASSAELHASLLRFSNHLLLYWRVDETSATMLRKRVDHMDALLRFENTAAAAAEMNDALLACADGLRASLAIDTGLIVAWTDSAAPVHGVRWASSTGVLEPLDIVNADGAPAQRAVHRFLTNEIWPGGADGSNVPSVLPIYTPARQHAGYVIASISAAPAEDWHAHLREWSVALGRAIERIRETARDDANRAQERSAMRNSRPGAAGVSDDVDRTLLRQRNIARAAMAALHGPLSTITSQAHHVISQEVDRETQLLVEEMAKQARNAARAMADLRIIAGGGETPNEFILINAPLRQFLHAARPRLERRSIQLTEHFADGLPRIRADVRKLNHLFTNLFTFIEHRLGHTGRTIVVSSIPSDDRAAVCVRIEVSGFAITRDNLENLFAPFDDRDRASNEFALALAACAAIVSETGGSIAAAANGGTTVFTIVFDAVHAVLAVEPPPVAHTPPSIAFGPSAPPQPPEETDALPRVLIVDDDDVMRDLMKQALLRREYRVETAKDGNEALRAIDAARVDVVLLDLLMPNRNGFEVLRALKRRSPAPPAIVMTGSRSVEIRNEANDLGATSFLQKPFELGQLLAEVESVLVHQHA